MNQTKSQIRLKRTDGTWYEQTIEHFYGAVQDNGLVVLPSQTIYVEADVSGDQLTNFLAIDHIEKPEKTIVATFGQQDDGGMSLSLTQPFNRGVKFDLEILRLGGDHFEATSSLPVKAGIKLTEMWPYPISMVVLKNARLIDDNAPNDSDLANPKSGEILFEKIESKKKLSWIWWTVISLVFLKIIGNIFLKK